MRTTPFALTNGHNVVILAKIVLQKHVVAYYHEFTIGNYTKAVMMELEKLGEVRLKLWTN